jgi:hypothetical protein
MSDTEARDVIAMNNIHAACVFLHVGLLSKAEDRLLMAEATVYNIIMEVRMDQGKGGGRCLT